MGRFLITGGNGYIGSHMCQLLDSLGHGVFIVDNHTTSPNEKTHNYGHFVRGDIADQKLIIQMIQEHRIDCVIHFAARALVPEGEVDPFLYYRENVLKTLSLLDSCIQGGLRKFIFSSTCATFGVPETKIIGENHPQNPINTYGNTKKIMELAMRDLADKGLLDVVVFRYFNAAGCDPQGNIGENHEPETHLIPNLVKAYLKGESGLFKLYGDQMPTRDGSCIRDYIHVVDLVKAHFQGHEFLQNHKGFYDFNLGSERGSSVLEVIAAFEKITQQKVKKQIQPPRPGDPPCLVSDSAKAKKQLNFTCQYTLEDCIEHCLAYFKKKQL